MGAMTDAVLGNTYDRPAAAFAQRDRDLGSPYLIRRPGPAYVPRDAEFANPHRFDIEAEIEPTEAKEFNFDVRGTKISYVVSDKKLYCLGKTAQLAPVNVRIKLRLLVDRTSLEIFGNDGRVTMSSCFLPRPDNQSLALVATKGAAKIVSLRVHQLKSAWEKS
jgi:sucrose-6-phosphate hydrolase SacC (GH32 family)